MKRLLRIIPCLCLCVVLLSGCGYTQDDLDESWIDGHVDGYDEGYRDGYEEGLWDGVSEARKDLASEAYDQYSAMEGQTTKERGLHPEEAVMVLKDYLDGEYISNDELKTAIRSISYFYYHAWDVIHDIEDMDVYFD